jgi:hypothetical protein
MGNKLLPGFTGCLDGWCEKERHQHSASHPKHASADVNDTKKPQQIGHFVSLVKKSELITHETQNRYAQDETNFCLGKSDFPYLGVGGGFGDGYVIHRLPSEDYKHAPTLANGRKGTPKAIKVIMER